MAVEATSGLRPGRGRRGLLSSPSRVYCGRVGGRSGPCQAGRDRAAEWGRAHPPPPSSSDIRLTTPTRTPPTSPSLSSDPTSRPIQLLTCTVVNGYVSFPVAACAQVVVVVAAVDPPPGQRPRPPLGSPRPPVLALRHSRTQRTHPLPPADVHVRRPAGPAGECEAGELVPADAHRLVHRARDPLQGTRRVRHV